MGIVLQKLGEKKLKKSSLGKIELEYNSGDVVHFQTEDMRLELTKKEFVELANQIIKARRVLREKKGFE